MYLLVIFSFNKGERPRFVKLYSKFFRSNSEKAREQLLKKVKNLQDQNNRRQIEGEPRDIEIENITSILTLILNKRKFTSI